MQIRISLPPIESDEKGNQGYEVVKHFLKQVELSVHHAQKSLEEMNKMNSELENPQSIYVTYRADNIDYEDEGDIEGTPAGVTIELFTA